MTIGHPMRNDPTPSNILPFVQPGLRLDESYDRVLAGRETELREALAKIQALRRQHDEITQPNGSMVGALFAAHDAAVCRLASLTSRQHEILDMVLAGRPSKIIAWELGISQRTVENHRAAIMKKTASKSIPALAQFAIAAAISRDAGIEMAHDGDKETQQERTLACIRN